jgi:hypothetical protein
LLQVLLEKATQQPQPGDDTVRVMLSRVTRVPAMKEADAFGGSGNNLAAIAETSHPSASRGPSQE